MADLTKEQSELLNAKLIIADLTMELYKAKAEIYRLRQTLEINAKPQQEKK